MAAIRCSFEEGYRLLPRYCEQVRRANPGSVANVYRNPSDGTRFGQLTANADESVNGWVREASGLPIVQMMERIRRQLMTWFNERREASMRWTMVLVPSAEERVAEAIERARGYTVVVANEAVFEVLASNEGLNVVDIRSRCCSCRGWQLYGLPCAHAVAALLSCRQNVHRIKDIQRKRRHPGSLPNIKLIGPEISRTSCRERVSEVK
ncbi:hypothetical protein QJS10_CPB15g01977 [Acorus calamus]|uniref:SWIM-type domain-containing protein n=1 Tax=Acorus calamus TaxID=4465 RepID=A0AAV9DC56_ACOCL|nr:hypothetical protein QJS10_CPB15g01977 [Acorus calamus]